MWLDAAFLRGFDKNIIGKFSYLPSRIESMKVSQKNHVLVVDSHLPCDMFNIICCNGPADLSSICKSIDHFRSQKLPYAFWIGFENEPVWLEVELKKLGLITDEVECAMACDINQFEKQFDDSDVRKICNKEGIQDLIYIMKGIFPKHEHSAIESFYHKSESCLLSEDSQLTFFVGYQGEKPVSLVSVYCDEEIASIFDVIVLPEMRGKGLGKLMTQTGVLEAKSKGYDRCILTATNDAKYLYQKLGFVDLKFMKVYHELS